MGAFFSRLLLICGIKPQKEEVNVEYTIEDTNSSNTSYDTIPTEYSETVSEDTTDSDTSFESIASEDLEEELELQEIALEQMTEAIDFVEQKTTMFTVSNEKRALVIGINYDEDQFQGDDLQGCVNDMNNIKQVLQERCYFLDEDITTLKNSEATRDNIEEELLNLVIFSHKNPGSEIWLSYSGHGSNVNSFREEDLKSEVICPSDYAKRGVITDTWIQENFVQGLEKTTKVFVLMDCCNSGSNLNLPYRYNRGDIINNDSSYTIDELENLCNIVKISGCEDDQTSADYYERKENEFQGALTNGFIHFHDDNDKSIIHFYNNILAYLTFRGFTQTPVLTFSNTNMLNSNLYPVATPPVATTPTVTPPTNTTQSAAQKVAAAQEAQLANMRNNPFGF